MAGRDGGTSSAASSAALMAQGLRPYAAASLSCHLLGLAGVRAESPVSAYGVLSSEIADALSLIMQR